MPTLQRLPSVPKAGLWVGSRLLKMGGKSRSSQSAATRTSLSLLLSVWTPQCSRRELMLCPCKYKAEQPSQDNGKDRRACLGTAALYNVLSVYLPTVAKQKVNLWLSWQVV